MKNLIAVCVLFMSLFSTLIKAQITNPEEKPYIEVTGSADMEVVPDRIYIRIIIRERFDKSQKITIEQSEKELREYLASLAIPAEDLYLSDANVGYVRIKYRTKDVLSQKEYMLILHSATTVGKVFQGLDKLDITDASIDRLDHSKMDEFRKEVKIKAIKAAKDKATHLLNAIGEEPGKPIVVRESQVNSRSDLLANQRVNYSSNLYKTEEKSVSFGEEIEFNKIRIVCEFYIKYEIK